MKLVDIQSLARENVKKMKPYSSARDEYQGHASVYLDANENPLATEFNRYPDPQQSALKERIAEIKKVRPDQLFLGNGSDEPIDLLIRAFCEPGRDNVVIPQPTYGMYSVSADVNNVEIRSVPLTKEFDLDEVAISNTWNKNSKLLFLCSPNNPSGNLLDPKKIIRLLSQFPGLVVVDEAYIDFTEVAGFVPLLDEFNNLVVLQTLSKAWGMAGIRLGMCFSNPEIIQFLNKIKPPYNINSLTQSVALDNLKLESRKNDWVKEIRKQREWLSASLSTLKLVQHIFPSDANFLLVKVNNAAGIYQNLVRNGIIVRDRSNVILCDQCLRITVGTEQENKQLISELKLL